MWYPADTRPAVLLQLRAWLSGRLAPLPHPIGAYDYVWGRGGMHTNFGLGQPIIALPFHVVARLFGLPGFPDHLRFLVLYAVTTALFAYALQRASPRKGPRALVTSAGVSAFVLLLPTFVGMIAARFNNYEQTIAVGALWSVLLLAGVLVLLERATTPRFVIVCAAAAFAIFIRPTLAAYGLTTVALATLIALRGGLPRRGLVAGIAAGVFVSALYLVANFVRFGSPFDPGYANLVSLTVVNRLTRWGLEFATTPLGAALKEMFATLFLLPPESSTIVATSPASVPAPVAAYAVGERWREYSSPTYDLWVFAAWIGAMALVVWRVVRGRLWRRDRDLTSEVAIVVGLWALPTSIVLFVFYAKVGNFATRYAVDLSPAYAAAMVCVGMVIVDTVRERAPRLVALVELTIAAVACVYVVAGRGWGQGPRRPPEDRQTFDARLAALDAQSRDQPIPPSHIQCGDPRGPEPVYGHLAQWNADCTVRSGTIFAFPLTPCITFTFAPGGKNGWSRTDDAALAGFRAHADFDALVACGKPNDAGETRSLTLCEPHPPPFILDGMRLYAIASLDSDLRPMDWLRLMRIDAAPACP